MADKKNNNNNSQGLSTSNSDSNRPMSSGQVPLPPTPNPLAPNISSSTLASLFKSSMIPTSGLEQGAPPPLHSVPTVTSPTTTTQLLPESAAGSQFEEVGSSSSTKQSTLKGKDPAPEDKPGPSRRKTAGRVNTAGRRVPVRNGEQVGADVRSGRTRSQQAADILSGTSLGREGKFTSDESIDDINFEIDPDQFVFTTPSDTTDTMSRVYASEASGDNSLLFEFFVQVKVPNYKHISSRILSWAQSVAETALPGLLAVNPAFHTVTDIRLRNEVLKGLAVYSNCVGDGALDMRKGRGFIVKVTSMDTSRISTQFLISQQVVGVLINRGVRSDKSVTIYRCAQVLYSYFASWALTTRYVPNWYPAQDKDLLNLNSIPYSLRSNSNTILHRDKATSADCVKFRNAFHDFMMTIPAERRPTYSRDVPLENLIANSEPAPQMIQGTGAESLFVQGQLQGGI